MSKTPSAVRRHVVVIGGGISGLAAAHRLVELDPEVQITLLEAADKLGGVLETIDRDGFRVESGADNFITTAPWALDLCKRIGFTDQLLQTNSQHRHAFVVRSGKLQPIPDGFVVMAPNKIGPILTTPILSPLGKLRLAWERFVPRRKETGDESLASFCRRRLGREVYERLVQPLVGGIYTGDPERLSLDSTMPRFAEMEREHGSLIRAMRSARKPTESTSGARYSMFVAPRQGMTSFVEAIAKRLPPESIRLHTPVLALKPTAVGWSIVLGGDGNSPNGDTLECDAVILATPAAVTAKLTASLDPVLSAELNGIHHASCSIISLGYDREQIAHPLDGFGVVVPAVENRKILSASFSSIKYTDRAADGKVLIRVFVGGDCQKELAELPFDRLFDLAKDELSELLGIKGLPEFTHISRRLNAMPQYFVGHADKVARIRQRVNRYEGLFLAGNAYEGVGIPNCIRSGEQAAERLAELLPNSAASSVGVQAQR